MRARQHRVEYNMLSQDLTLTQVEAEPNSRLSMIRHELLSRASFQERESPAGT